MPSQNNPLPPIPNKADPKSKTDTLFEQIGSNSSINQRNDFKIALPDGGSESAATTLPDVGEL